MQRSGTKPPRTRSGPIDCGQFARRSIQIIPRFAVAGVAGRGAVYIKRLFRRAMPGELFFSPTTVCGELSPKLRILEDSFEGRSHGRHVQRVEVERGVTADLGQRARSSAGYRRPMRQ